jgi:hypothetical protein
MSENQTPSETPDGATPPAAPPDSAPQHDPNEVMSRAEFQRVVQQRDEHKRAREPLERELADLRAQLATARKVETPPPPAPPPKTDAPEWAQTILSRLDGFDQQLGTLSSTRQQDAMQAVLDGVPDGSRNTAKALLPTLGVDFASPTAAVDALAKLQSEHPSIMLDHSRGAPLRAPQVGADGKPNFDSYNHPDEIPPEHRAAAFKDPATLARLRAGVGGGSTRDVDGYNI